MARRIEKWYYFPALIWLLIAVAAGTWIRFEWHNPQQTFFEIPNLIHAHTHAALLGWVYLVMAGFTLRHFIQEETAQKLLVPMSVALQISNVGMLVSFALGGYAFWSILFSSLHLFLTLWLAILFLFSADKNRKGLSRDFAAAAWLWQVLSGFGPFALAFTGGMSGTMAQFWLGSYLFLLLNGWIIFMMLSIWFNQPDVAARSGRLGQIGFNIMYISLLPALLSMLYPLGISESLIRAGFIFNLIHGIGILLLLPALWPRKSASLMVHFVLITACILLGIKAIIQPVSYFPDLIHITQNHLLKVGFLHMVLLALLSPLLLVLLYTSLQKAEMTVNVILGSIMLSVLTTTAILFWIPLGSMAGIFLFWPWQLILGISGLTFTIAILAASYRDVTLKLNTTAN
ncbi:MAG: hypothetical protein LAT67_11865 [Balneolales bacterium]|nr:hypothetical protein [Balneolales bacterium]